MPTYKITQDGTSYKVTAPSQEEALAALGIMNERENTLEEDIQGAGQKILDGLFFGYGDEISAAGRAGLGALFEGLASSTDEAPDFGSIQDLVKDYDREVEKGREIEEAFTRDNKALSMGLEVGAALTTGVGLSRLAGTAATRGMNAARNAGIATADMAAYQIGEKEGSFSERLEQMDSTDALVIGAGTVLGGAAGSLIRGTDPASSTMGELIGAANKAVAKGTMKTGEVSSDVIKGTGRYVEAVGDKLTGGRISPVVDMIQEEIVMPTVEAVAHEIKPLAAAVSKYASKAFVPVRDTANRIQVGYGNRMERGAINGQRNTERVDKLMFDTHKLGRIREATVDNDRFKAAMADFGNPELKQSQRDLAKRVMQQELGQTDFDDLMKFFDDQEEILNELAGNTQTYKRNYGYVSVARMGKGQETLKEVADKTLKQQREASEAAARLTTSDATAKEKLKLARLSKDGSDLSSYGRDNPIHHPVDSHHYFMRSNAQMGSMNKALGIRGAQTAEEMEEVAAGRFYQGQLRQAFADPKKAEDAVELYNQVVWGSQRSMHKGLQVVRNLGYSSTIANPYGAFLQLHDGMNAAFMHGSDNMVKSMLNKAGFNLTMEEVGIVRQHFNEMTSTANRAGGGTDRMFKLAQATESLLEKAMQLSGFKYGDTVMKGKIMNSGLLQEQAILKNNPAKWRDKWKYTFDKAELDELEVALRDADNSNDLLKQLGLLKLSKLQPISAASNTYYQLAVPNARIFYMLKGFAITQLSMIRNSIKAAHKEGGVRAAGADMARYMILSGGGYGVVHETRQIAKGDLPDYSNVPALAFYQLLSIATMGGSGGTQYGYNQFTQAPIPTLISNFTVPPTGPIEGVAKDAVELALGSSDNPNKFVPDETLKDIPVIGPLLGSFFDD